MLNIVFKLIKKFILAVLFIYTYNIVVFPLNMVIPFNVFNIVLITFLGVPAAIVICLFSLIVL